MQISSFNPERIESISPGLRGTSYPGFANKQSSNPERVESLSRIPFVKVHFVAPQKLAGFILKRNLAMMLLLPGCGMDSDRAKCGFDSTLSGL
jgi:hypothetical protein